MPYIDTEARRRLDAGERPRNAGELNYAITRLVDRYMQDLAKQGRGGLRYGHLNEVVGVLECAKLEAYRRLAAPYEDRKMAEAGDVYESGAGGDRAGPPEGGGT